MPDRIVADQPSLDRHAAAALLDEVATDPWGAVTASIYDTARLVSLTPSLPGHTARLRFLIAGQRSDGLWGEADGYALVPTLSAVEAVLATLRRPPVAGVEAGQLRSTAQRGLAALRHWSGSRAPVPDTIAVELVVPALVAAINAHLDAAGSTVGSGVRLAVPAGMDPTAADRLAARVQHGGGPQTWWASLEALGAGAERLATVRPHDDGMIACSPAATAAWLGEDADRSTPAAAAAARYLDRLQAAGGGPVAGVWPITYFEQSWVLSTLAPVMPGISPAASVLDSLDAALGPDGAPAAPSLPPDCDDAAVVLTALHRHGRARPVDALLRYHTGAYFRCFPSERTPSVSTTAHALETLHEAMAAQPADRRRLDPVAVATAAWLVDVQSADGCWWDKWHASPYYATACCVDALLPRAADPARQAVRRAVTWTVATQHSDGSWGRWGGTVEETAYGVHVLASAGAGAGIDVTAAVMAGAAYLRQQPDSGPHRGLWHAKDLYAPLRVIRAARLAALGAADRFMMPSGAAPAGAVAAPLVPAPRAALS
ncbi:prenyltransferase [Dactylosporangium sp. NPDC050688]|uniref:prenyltransferase n=1 Tax=Dactylosporangium sp. NPDC050688 TaxID=3157217 RepID=UPI0033E31B87